MDVSNTGDGVPDACANRYRGLCAYAANGNITGFTAADSVFGALRPIITDEPRAFGPMGLRPRGQTPVSRRLTSHRQGPAALRL